jgi:hypothetical protein
MLFRGIFVVPYDVAFSQLSIIHALLIRPFLTGHLIVSDSGAIHTECEVPNRLAARNRATHSQTGHLVESQPSDHIDKMADMYANVAMAGTASNPFTRPPAPNGQGLTNIFSVISYIGGPPPATAASSCILGTTSVWFLLDIFKKIGQPSASFRRAFY